MLFILTLGDLILRKVSRLYAFSAYPDRTSLPSYAPGGTTGTQEVRSPRSSRTKGWVAFAHPQLVQPRALAHQHRESARRNLRVKRAAITGFDAVEGAAAIGNQPREHVDAAGGTLRIGDAGDAPGKLNGFEQRHDIDTAGFQHRAMRQVDLVHHDGGEFLLHRRIGARAGNWRARDRLVAPRRRSTLRAGSAYPRSPLPPAPRGARGSAGAAHDRAGCRSNDAHNARCRPYRPGRTGFLRVGSCGHYRRGRVRVTRPVKETHGFLGWPRPSRSAEWALRRAGQSKAATASPIQNHETALVARATNEASEGLFQPEPRHQIVIALAEAGAPRLVQNRRFRPRHFVEHDQAQRTAGHVDTVAQRIGPEQARIFFAAEQIDQRAGIEPVDMLRIKRKPCFRQWRGMRCSTARNVRPR